MVVQRFLQIGGTQLTFPPRQGEDLVPGSFYRARFMHIDMPCHRRDGSLMGPEKSGYGDQISECSSGNEVNIHIVSPKPCLDKLRSFQRIDRSEEHTSELQ